MVTEIPLTADQLGAVPFRHVLRDPVDDFSFRFRAGDGQTPWHTVRVADRPVIQAASVTVTESCRAARRFCRSLTSRSTMAHRFSCVSGR